MKARIALLALAAGCAPAPAVPDARSDDTPAAADADVGTDTRMRARDICDELALDRAPAASPGEARFGEVAGDFTVTTLGDSWSYSRERSGCESYVFFNYLSDPRTAPTTPWLGDTLWDRAVLDTFLTEGPRNVQYFFTSDEASDAARRTRAEDLRDKLEESLAIILDDEVSRSEWRERFHFVLDRATEVPGSVGALLRDELAYARAPDSAVDLGDRGRAPVPLPFFFAIDRHQRFHAGDDLSPQVGGTPRLGMAVYAALFFNHLWDLDQRLTTDDAVVVPVLRDERTRERTFDRDATLPTAAQLATFNHLEIEIAITCDARNPFACSEWDRIASVHVCTSIDCEERREFARWITPYWRRGPQHWSIDASPLLPLLARGGTQRFRIETGPEWERPTEYLARVALRFRSVEGDLRPIAAVPAFGGGEFDASYNDRMPLRFALPTASRVELVTLLSGHGQAPGSNCAEWCDHQHLFGVGGVWLDPLAHGGRIGSSLGCARRARDGVPPNQLGNWAIERAYWCPGLPVEIGRIDLTPHLRGARTFELDYEARLGGSGSGGGEIALSSYVVAYE